MIPAYCPSCGCLDPHQYPHPIGDTMITCRSCLSVWTKVKLNAMRTIQRPEKLTMSKAEEHIIQMLTQLHQVQPELISRDAKLAELGILETERMEFIGHLEELTGKHATADEERAIQTVGDAVAFVMVNS